MATIEDVWTCLESWFGEQVHRVTIDEVLAQCHSILPAEIREFFELNVNVAIVFHPYFDYQC